MNMHSTVGETREGALAGALRGMDGLLRRIQLRAAEYLPEGDPGDFINDVLELIDGPEQREVQGRAKELLMGEEEERPLTGDDAEEQPTKPDPNSPPYRKPADQVGSRDAWRHVAADRE